MGNKPSTGTKPGKAPRRGGPSPASLLLQQQLQQQGLQPTDDALEAELRAAQEAALRMTTDVDLLAQELRLEQQLAALDDEVEEGGYEDQLREAGELDDEVDIDPDEMAELEGELQELEREVLGPEGDDEEEEEDDDASQVQVAGAAGARRSASRVSPAAAAALAASAAAAVAVEQARRPPALTRHGGGRIGLAGGVQAGGAVGEEEEEEPAALPQMG